MKLFNILVLLLSLTMSAAKADDRSLGDVIGDIYSKGELDGQSVFFVLGMDEAREIAKDNISQMSTAEDLKEAGIELGSDLKDTSRLIFNHGNNDIIGAAEIGVEASKESAKFILTGPRDTLRKLPNAFKVSMHNAREGYYESENEIVGGFKYAGHATWIMVKGSYYLLVEAPAKAVLGAVGAALGVPAALAFQGAAIATNLVIDVGTFTLKVGYGAIKNTFRAMIIASTYAYSAVSATSVAVVTTVFALPVYAYQGIKYLRPRVKLGSYKLVQKDTDENREKSTNIAIETLKRMAAELDLDVSKTFIKTRDVVRRIGPKRSITKVVGKAVSLMNKGKDILRINVSFSRKSTKLTGKLKYRTYKELQRDDYSKDQLKAMFDGALAI